jgi:hypothetical protein
MKSAVAFSKDEAKQIAKAKIKNLISQRLNYRDRKWDGYTIQRERNGDDLYDYLFWIITLKYIRNWWLQVYVWIIRTKFDAA